jgi:hypothetical protein
MHIASRDLRSPKQCDEQRRDIHGIAPLGSQGQLCTLYCSPARNKLYVVTDIVVYLYCIVVQFCCFVTDDLSDVDLVALGEVGWVGGRREAVF